MSSSVRSSPPASDARSSPTLRPSFVAIATRLRASRKGPACRASSCATWPRSPPRVSSTWATTSSGTAPPESASMSSARRDGSPYPNATQASSRAPFKSAAPKESSSSSSSSSSSRTSSTTWTSTRGGAMTISSVRNSSTGTGGASIRTAPRFRANKSWVAARTDAGVATEDPRVALSTAIRRTHASTSRPFAQSGAPTSFAASSTKMSVPTRPKRFRFNRFEAIAAASVAVKSGKSIMSDTRLFKPGFTRSNKVRIWPPYPANTTTSLFRYSSSVNKVTISSTAS
mmetsp:Transcript_12624/g.33323  ORF Transcript_12624/g.33323 Transcript_12624/m.33323 type:complete len:286 (-) Transcript_12624:2703-3560(-)